MSPHPSKVLVAGAVLAGMFLTGCSAGSGGGQSAAASDCKPTHTFSTVSSGKLTVAAPDFAPFVTLTGGTPSGIDVDIVQEIAAMECLTPTYSQVDYSGAIPAVQSGRADIAIGDYYRTTTRAQVVGLSDAMYFDGMGIISKDGVTDMPTIITRKVGTVDGYLWVADLKKVMGDNLKIYKSNVEMWADLKAGRIDVGIDSIPAGAFHAKENGTEWKVGTAQPDARIGASEKPAQTTLPYPKSNTALGTALNEDIATLHKNGKLAEIFTKHGIDPKQTEVGESYLLGS